jgi:hypothetical protein
LQTGDQIVVAAIGRRVIRVLGFVEPGLAFILMAARPAPIDGAIADGDVIRHDFQLPVDAHLLHHASHQGGSRISSNQVFEKIHVGTLLNRQSLPCRAACGVDLDQRRSSISGTVPPERRAENRSGRKATFPLTPAQSALKTTRLAWI